MLVPSMTMKEIRKEIEKDFPSVIHHASVVQDNLMKNHRQLFNRRIVHVGDMVSNQKNNWIYKIVLKRKLQTTNFLAYYFNDIGLSAVEATVGPYMLFFTTHFFKRYNERLKLNLVNPYDILHHYMKWHSVYQFKTVKKITENLVEVFGVNEQGALLGTLDTELNFYKINTFITNEMLKGEQMEEEARIKALMEKYMET